MKILVVSDTHRETSALSWLLKKFRGRVDLLLHLGDCVSDAQEVMKDFPTVAFLGVLGNCDYRSGIGNFAYEGSFSAENKRIFYTHGHKYNVNFGLEYLASNAKMNGADIVFYGHTHVSHAELLGNVLVINPGSLTNPRDGSKGTYAYVEIDRDNVKYKISEVEI